MSQMGHADMTAWPLDVWYSPGSGHRDRAAFQVEPIIPAPTLHLVGYRWDVGGVLVRNGRVLAGALLATSFQPSAPDLGAIVKLPAASESLPFH